MDVRGDARLDPRPDRSPVLAENFIRLGARGRAERSSSPSNGLFGERGYLVHGRDGDLDCDDLFITREDRLSVGHALLQRRPGRAVFGYP
jgi:hypothetical protein